MVTQLATPIPEVVYSETRLTILPEVFLGINRPVVGFSGILQVLQITLVVDYSETQPTKPEADFLGTQPRSLHPVVPGCLAPTVLRYNSYQITKGINYKCFSLEQVYLEIHLQHFLSGKNN